MSPTTISKTNIVKVAKSAYLERKIEEDERTRTNNRNQAKDICCKIKDIFDIEITATDIPVIIDGYHFMLSGAHLSVMGDCPDCGTETHSISIIGAATLGRMIVEGFIPAPHDCSPSAVSLDKVDS